MITKYKNGGKTEGWISGWENWPHSQKKIGVKRRS